LALDSRGLGDSVACSSGSLGHPSPLVGAYFGHRTLRAGAAPRVRPFTAVRGRLLRPRL